MKKLVFIDLSKNPLTSIPQNLCNLPELKVLNLNKTALRSLPTKIDLPKLEFILFPERCLEKLPTQAASIANKNKESTFDTFFPAHWNDADFDNLIIPEFIDNIVNAFPLNDAICLGREEIPKFYELVNLPVQNETESVVLDQTIPIVEEQREFQGESFVNKMLKVGGVALTSLIFISQLFM